MVVVRFVERFSSDHGRKIVAGRDVTVPGRASTA